MVFLVYVFNDTVYMSEQEAMQAVMNARPDLLDDDLPDFFNDNVEEVEAVKCEFCGRIRREANYTHHILIAHPEEQ